MVLDGNPQFKPEYSSTYIARTYLRELQEKKQSWLTLQEIYLALQTHVPHLTSETGTTLEDDVKILEKHRIIKHLEEDRFYVLCFK